MYKVYKEIGEYEFLTEEGKIGFLIFNNKENTVRESDSDIEDIDFKKIETVVNNNYSWDNVPNKDYESLYLFFYF